MWSSGAEHRYSIFTKNGNYGALCRKLIWSHIVIYGNGIWRVPNHPPKCGPVSLVVVRNSSHAYHISVV